MRNLKSDVTSITYTMNQPAGTLTVAVVAGGVTYTKTLNKWNGDKYLFDKYELPKYEEWPQS